MIFDYIFTLIYLCLDKRHIQTKLNLHSSLYSLIFIFYYDLIIQSLYSLTKINLVVGFQFCAFQQNHSDLYPHRISPTFFVFLHNAETKTKKNNSYLPIYLICYMKLIVVVLDSTLRTNNFKRDSLSRCFIIMSLCRILCT